jgi:IS1 family transposase
VDPERDNAEVGEQWTWSSICRASQLTIAWHIGKRDAAGADAIVGNTRARLVVMPQIATDGLGLYEAAILRHFGYAVPYVQTVKRFAQGGGRPGVAEKFSHAKGVDFIEKRVIFGAPDLSKATTYAIERSHLTSRQWNARLHRRTLAFSKRVESHRASIAVQHVYRNLCHIPRNMRVTPAMAAGLTDKVWSLSDLMVTALSEVPGERPSPKPLVIPRPDGTARELPGGRGWLRVVSGGSGAPSPAPAPATPPAAPISMEPAADATGQLDLLSWRPKAKPLPPLGAQLSLFDDDGKLS